MHLNVRGESCIDELADMMMLSAKEVELHCRRLAQRAGPSAFKSCRHASGPRPRSSPRPGQE